MLLYLTNLITNFLLFKKKKKKTNFLKKVQKQVGKMARIKIRNLI
jgi:hypothetical protein